MRAIVMPLLRRKWLVVFLGGFGTLLALVLLARAKGPGEAPLPALRFAVPTQLSAGGVYVAAERKLFQKHNVDVRTRPFRLGMQALAAVLAGEADLALVADTPFMLAVLKGQKIAAVAQAFGSRKAMALLARADRGIATADDLRGKRIGTVKGTNAQFFIDVLLSTHGLSLADVEVQSMSPQALPLALEAGEIDAATLWLPDLAMVRQRMGAQAVMIEGRDIFVYRMLIVGRTDYLDSHVAEVAQVLGAIAEATETIQAEPAQARAVIAAAIGLDPAVLQPAFAPADFQLQLDQALLLALGDQARWAVRKGLASPVPEQDYRRLLHPQALQRARPTAMRLVREVPR